MPIVKINDHTARVAAKCEGADCQAIGPTAPEPATALARAKRSGWHEVDGKLLCGRCADGGKLKIPPKGRPKPARLT